MILTTYPEMFCDSYRFTPGELSLLRNNDEVTAVSDNKCSGYENHKRHLSLPCTVLAHKNPNSESCARLLERFGCR
ncbi:hypothetical protein IMY05_C5091001600 [Salix suchowensis]|nr:hypothetical protein IMY05_C5091001600 [Salix suchowensis]